jgi:hypothetical protein
MGPPVEPDRRAMMLATSEAGVRPAFRQLTLNCQL